MGKIGGRREMAGLAGGRPHPERKVYVHKEEESIRTIVRLLPIYLDGKRGEAEAEALPVLPYLEGSLIFMIPGFPDSHLLIQIRLGTRRGGRRVVSAVAVLLLPPRLTL